MPPNLEQSEKLRASRERLRATMLGYSAPRRATQGGNASSFSSLQDAIKSIPGASIVVDAIMSWWAQHPLRSAVLVASSAGKVVVKPLAERNPIALMFGMAVLGALVVWKRPWRWLLTPALFVGLLPQLMSKFAQQMPIESWFAAFEPPQGRPHQGRTSEPVSQPHAPDHR
jgi:hypothetical protein